MNFMYPPLRSDFLRSQYIANVSIFSSEMLVFIDESGFDHRDALRQYGYSPIGQPSRAAHLQRGKHLSVIAAMCTDDVIGTQIFEGGVNSNCFQKYMDMELCSSSIESILEV